MKYLLIFAVMLMAGPAFAQTKVDKEKLPAPGTAAKKAAPAPVEEDEETPATPEEQALLLCQTTQIMGSSPATPTAVGPDYQAGVDAYGRPVAPADGGGSAPQYAIPDEINIPLNIRILETVGITPTPDLNTTVGNITIKKGGQVLYNGQNMTTNVQDYCKKHLDVKVTQ